MGAEVAKKYDQMEDMYKIFQEDSSQQSKLKRASVDLHPNRSIVRNIHNAGLQ